MKVWILFESVAGSGVYRHDMIVAVYDTPEMARDNLEKYQRDNKTSVYSYYIREWEVTSNSP